MICLRPSNGWRDEPEPARERMRPTAIPVILLHPQKTKPLPSKRPPLRMPIARDLALQRGYEALTVMYHAEERWMLENVIADMERGGISYQLVGVLDKFDNYLVEVWRQGLFRTANYERVKLWRERQNEEPAS
jgi:hypothetical protein